MLCSQFATVYDLCILIEIGLFDVALVDVIDKPLSVILSIVA